MFSLTELKDTLSDSLNELGLTEHEINLYTVSLSLGPTAVAELAKHIGVTRPNIYKLISSLETRGLAKFSTRRKYARTFMVESPAVVASLVRAKRTALNNYDQKITQAMPDLLALYQQGELPTSIKIFQGKDQYLKIFYQVLDEAKDEMYYFGEVGNFITFISWEEERQWMAERIKKGLRIKTLVLPSPEADTLVTEDVKNLRETKILPMPLPFKTSFILFANKAIIWQPETPLAILIEDSYITDMLKSIFLALWQR